MLKCRDRHAEFIPMDIGARDDNAKGYYLQSTNVIPGYVIAKEPKATAAISVPGSN